MRAQRALVGGLLATCLMVTAGARANGAFPAVSQLVVDPDNADHLFLRSTFGLVLSRDAGKTWDWVCEAGLGYADIEPPMAVLSGGIVLLGTSTGVSVGDVTGCDFHAAAGISGLVTDLSAEPSLKGGAVAAVVDLQAPTSRVWESADGGKTFAPLGEPIANFKALTLDVASDDPGRIYLSGVEGDVERNVLVASTDRGKTWVVHPIPGSDGSNWPYIAAINPVRHDTVYVRLNGFPGRLEVTKDGGAHFTEALLLDGYIQGFAVSPDGETLLASSSYLGVLRASDAALAFERLSCAGVTCLSWSHAGVLGCGEQSRNKFVVGRSSDEGATFERLLDMPCIRGPLACGMTTSAGAVCPDVWPMLASQLGLGMSACPSGESIPSSTECLNDGGAADAAVAEGGISQPATGGAGTGSGGAAGAAAAVGRGGTSQSVTGGAGGGGAGATGGAPQSGSPSAGVPTRDQHASCACTLQNGTSPVPQRLLTCLLVLGGNALRRARRRRKKVESAGPSSGRSSDAGFPEVGLPQATKGDGPTKLARLL